MLLHSAKCCHSYRKSTSNRQSKNQTHSKYLHHSLSIVNSFHHRDYLYAYSQLRATEYESTLPSYTISPTKISVNSATTKALPVRYCVFLSVMLETTSTQQLISLMYTCIHFLIHARLSLMPTAFCIEAFILWRYNKGHLTHSAHHSPS